MNWGWFSLSAWMRYTYRALAIGSQSIAMKDCRVQGAGNPYESKLLHHKNKDYHHLAKLLLAGLKSSDVHYFWSNDAIKWLTKPRKMKRHGNSWDYVKKIKSGTKLNRLETIKSGNTTNSIACKRVKIIRRIKNPYKSDTSQILDFLKKRPSG